MSKTTIEWTQRPGTVGETWNPTTGCSKVDRGCKHCYAETMHHRLQAMGQTKYATPFLQGAVFHPETLRKPESWTTPRTVFVNSMSDLFHENVAWNDIDAVLYQMHQTPQHTYLVLTKRPERALEYELMINDRPYPGQPALNRWPPNLWMGTSAHDQTSLERRLPFLAQLDVTVRFLSAEPLLGPIRLPVDAADGSGFLEWVICGGESGPGAEPMNPIWPRSLRDQCAELRTPFFFKQWGGWEPSKSKAPYGVTQRAKYLFDRDGKSTRMLPTRKKSGNLLDGKTYQAFPITQTVKP